MTQISLLDDGPAARSGTTTTETKTSRPDVPGGKNAHSSRPFLSDQVAHANEDDLLWGAKTGKNVFKNEIPFHFRRARCFFTGPV